MRKSFKIISFIIALAIIAALSCSVIFAGGDAATQKQGGGDAATQKQGGSNNAGSSMNNGSSNKPIG